MRVAWADVSSALLSLPPSTLTIAATVFAAVGAGLAVGVLLLDR